jgi:hypothetical protein
VETAEDGFCDAAPIYELVDVNRNGVFEIGEFAKAVKNETVKHKLRTLVVEHPSEWYFPSTETGQKAKWGNRLMSPQTNPNKKKALAYVNTWERNQYNPPQFGFNYKEDKYQAFLEIAEKCSFLQQVKGFTENEKLWHFHPVAFVQHLKRIFDNKISSFGFQ